MDVCMEVCFVEFREMKNVYSKRQLLETATSL